MVDAGPLRPLENLIGMGQRKKDRTWPRPKGRRRHTRHAWLVRPGAQVPPVQAFVVAWECSRGKWFAYTVWVSDTGQVIQEWVPAERLGPVPVVERQMPGNPDYFAGF